MDKISVFLNCSYQKFTRGKDLTQYSEQDKSAILGSFKHAKEGKRKHKSEDNPEEPKKVGLRNYFTFVVIRDGLPFCA